jgi:hypothetical protein
MKIEDRIEAFVKLGKYLSAIDEAELRELMEKAKNENPWFTSESIKTALEGLSQYLRSDNLIRWTAPYRLEPLHPRTVALILAGNIPLVGFHDFLSVLVSGHAVMMKLSSKDSVLIKHLIAKLIEYESRFQSRITVAERLKNFDAVIATGSDNSARYFHYYFDKYPHVIRKNRTSCAVITGKESKDELQALGRDIFSYFGLGCRNVSKIYIPNNYHLSLLLDALESYKEIINHHKYVNNYDYQKSILLINQIPHLDSGFLLLQESDKLVSPIAVVYYERYNDEGSLALRLLEQKDKIQCVVGKATPESVPFGQAQSPDLWDYADQIDTLKFLERLT